MPKEETKDGTPLGEYNRFKASVQLGDGPDQRGEVTVELVREPLEGREGRTVSFPDVDDVEDALGQVEAEVNDAQFAEFYIELKRSTGALRESLGLPKE